MLTIKIQRQGDKFARLRREFPNKANAIIDKHADGAMSVMKQLAAVDTGHMRDSIDKKTLGPLTLGITIGAFYWPFVNYGTVHMQAQPFVEPGIESARRGFVEDLKKALREI